MAERRRWDRYEETRWRRQPAWPEAEPAVPRRPRRRRRVLWKWLLLPAVLAGLALLLLGLWAGVELHFRGRIFPNVYIAGVAVGEMTPEEAEKALRLHYEGRAPNPSPSWTLARPLTLIYEERAWQPTAGEIGLEVAWSVAISEALSIGRRGSLLEQWSERWQVWTGRRDILLPLVLDEDALRGYLQRLAQTIDVLPQETTLVVEGTQVSLRPGRPGHTLLVEPTLAAVREKLGRLSPEPVALVVDTFRPEIGEEEARRALETARRMLSGPVVLRLGERVWTLTPLQIGQMLRVERRSDPAGPVLAVELDSKALRDLTEKIAAEVRVLPRNAHFRSVGGHLEVAEEGAPGWELPVESTLEAIYAAVLSPDKREVALTLREVPPAITSETIRDPRWGIREVVGVGESHFAGSPPYREHNIVVGARLLDGILIAPGETFSFLEHIGPIDESQGFVEGYSIIAERTVRNVGGGICQVSTTVFRAALMAGLPIIERHPHAYRVKYYEQNSIVGLDATIFVSTGTDLKFRNDTPAYLLMQFEVYTDTDTLYVYLYGTKPNREVVLDGPYFSNWTPAPTEPVYVYNSELPQGYVRQTDWAVDGVDVVVYRKTLVDGKEVLSEPIFSPYRAWPNIYEVGTKP